MGLAQISYRSDRDGVRWRLVAGSLTKVAVQNWRTHGEVRGENADKDGWPCGHEQSLIDELWQPATGTRRLARCNSGQPQHNHHGLG
jgi:hypothetical protein